MNRYYSSQWGRFLSPDPYSGSASPSAPQTWNRYPYAGNDPANHTDPSGLDGLPGDPDPQLGLPDPAAWGEPAEPPFACDLFGGCQTCPTDDLWGGPMGFLPIPGPFGPICFFLPVPPPEPAAPAGQIQVVGKFDCYKPFVGAPNVWERDVSYYAYFIYPNGKSTELTGTSRAAISEHLNYISGQHPPPSSPHRTALL